MKNYRLLIAVLVFAFLVLLVLQEQMDRQLTDVQKRVGALEMKK